MLPLQSAADPARAADRRRRRGRGAARSSTRTTASRSISISTCGSPPTSSRCSRSAASWRPAAAAGRRRALERTACASPCGPRRTPPRDHGDRRPPVRAGGRARAAVRARARAGRGGDDHAPLRAARGRAAPGAARPASGARAARADALAGASARSWRPTTSSSTACCGARCSTSGCCTRALGGDGYYAAGVPWYATLFGRDSLITATQLLAFDPADGRADAARARRLIGTRDDAGHDEEPGKVIHELRERRGRAAGALPARPLLRHGRRDAAVPLPALRAADWTGDLVPVPRARAAGRGDARLDRRPGRPRRRRPARIPSARSHGPAQPGLEGLRRGRARRARGPAGAADRPR